MDFYYFIGIDIAKDTALAARPELGCLLLAGPSNTLTGIKTSLAELKALPNWETPKAEIHRNGGSWAFTPPICWKHFMH